MQSNISVDANAPLIQTLSNGSESRYRQYSNQSPYTEFNKHIKQKRQLGVSVNNLFNNLLNVNTTSYNFHKIYRKRNKNTINNTNKVIDQDDKLNKKRLSKISIHIKHKNQLQKHQLKQTDFQLKFLNNTQCQIISDKKMII